jgi:rSAM/selenodomain-associated transferase 1
MDKQKDRLLIIFYRNPVQGKVKTRLASAIGDKKALEIYLYLAHHTRLVTERLPFDKIIFYSEQIEANDLWEKVLYQKAVQEGSDLGQKMKNAFEEGFKRGYKSICIIGTDCIELTTAIIQNAFHTLIAQDAVIGTAKDGGYYLLGMKKFHPELFENKHWSTSSVAADTLENFKKLGLSYATLPTLRDIDTEDDLPDHLKKDWPI